VFRTLLVNACYCQAIIANDDDFVSKEAKTTHQLWMELCEMIATHPEQVCCELTNARGSENNVDKTGRAI
jgi:hypothetical protein